MLSRRYKRAIQGVSASSTNPSTTFVVPAGEVAEMVISGFLFSTASGPVGTVQLLKDGNVINTCDCKFLAGAVGQFIGVSSSVLTLDAGTYTVQCPSTVGASSYVSYCGTSYKA